MRRRSPFIVLLATLALLSGACATGGSDGEAEGPADEMDSASATEELSALASEWEGRDARVSYTLRAEANDSESRFELFWDGTEHRWRMDISAEGSEGSTTIISAEDNSIVCASGSESCFEIPSGQTPVPLPFLGQAFEQPDAFEETLLGTFEDADLETSERTIAGQAASCFSKTDEDESFEVCFSQDGLLLGWRTSTSSLEATEVGEVSDEDFDPPYEVQQIGQAPGGQAPDG